MALLQTVTIVYVIFCSTRATNSFFGDDFSQDQQPYTARSYFAGTSADNQYALPSTLTVNADSTSNPHNGNTDTQAKVFVTSTGADSARPLHVGKNDKGIWKANNWSSLLMGVKYIKPQVVDDL